MEGAPGCSNFTVAQIRGLSSRVETSAEVQGALDFRIGDLRGGAASPIRNIRATARPLYELSEATAGLQKGLHLVKVKGDGRCLFRSLCKGLIHNRGGHLTGQKETEAADEMRLAVFDALCRDEQRAKEFEEVNYSVENLEGGKTAYCRRLRSDGFWGGELEILVLSKMLHVPIYVYRTAEEAGLHKYGYVPIVKYGEQWAQTSAKGPGRKPVHLLYGNGNHYDVLL